MADEQGTMTAEDRQAIIDAVTMGLRKQAEPPTELYAALAKASAAFPEDEIDDSLGAIMAAVRKPLAENGLVLIQRLVIADPESDRAHLESANCDYLETKMIHVSGQSITNLTRIVAEHGYEPAIRNGIQLLLCLPTVPKHGDEGDHGNRKPKGKI